jgi:hypothetical protein
MFDLESAFGRRKVCYGVACFVEKGESTSRFGRSTARSTTEPTSLTTILEAVTLGRKDPAGHDRLLGPHLSMTLMRGIGPAPRRIGQAVRSGRALLLHRRTFLAEPVNLQWPTKS